MRLYCFTLGFFLLTVGAEKEDSQGYHAEQTKGTTVTKDLLLKKENAIGHGTAAVPTENTLQPTAVAVTAKSPRAVLFDTRPTAPYETTQITRASAVIASRSRESFVSRNGPNSLTSASNNPSAMRIHTGSEIPLMSNYEKIVFSSTQTAFESMMNGTFKPEVHSSADEVKASLWLHTLLDNRNQRNTDSITLTSADGGPGVPILSASHPRVIDNLAALRNDNDDKRSEGKDEKGISNLGRNEHPFGTMQSIFQSDTAADSLRGNTVTNLCLTCLKDRTPVSTEKSVALPAPSPGGSSDSLSTEGLALDFNQFTTSLPSLHQQAVVEQEEIPKKEISGKNISKYSSFSVSELTFPPLSFSKSENQSLSILNNSHVKSFLSDTRTVAFDTPSLVEMSSATLKDIKKQAMHPHLSKTSVTERRISTTTAFYRSSKPLHTVRKPMKTGEQEAFGSKVSTADPQSKLIYLSENNKTGSHSVSTTKNEFIQNQPLNISSGSVSSTLLTAEAPHSSKKSLLPKGTDHSVASHPTASMRLIEAHRATTSFSFSQPTTSAVEHSESHPLTGRADSLISVLRSPTPAKPNSQTKETVLTLLGKDSAIKFASVTTKRHLTAMQDSHTSNTVNSIVKQSFVDPSGPASKPVIEEPQPPVFTTRKVPVKLFLSDSRRDFEDDVSMLTLTASSRKSFSERLTMSRLLGSQSKMTQERTFDVSNENHAASTRESFVTCNRDLIRESLMIHNLKKGDKNEQVLTVVAGDEDEEIIKMEGEQGKEIKETRKLEEEEESREDEKLGNKTEGLFRSDKMERGKQEKTINSGKEINQNTDPEEDEMEEHEVRKSIEEGGGTIGEEDVTLRPSKDPRRGEVRDEEDETEISRKNSSSVVAEKQRESLTKEGAEAGREETASMEDIKHNRESGREDMTDVPLGPTTNSEELNRDKGHTVTNLSTCHSLIKQLGATEHRGVHLGGNTAQIVEMKNKLVLNKVTSNHRPLHSTVRSQSLEQSVMTSFPKEPHTLIKPHPSTHRVMLTKHEATSSLPKESPLNTQKVVEATFSVTAEPKAHPKLSETLSTSKFSDALKPTFSSPSSATKSAHPELNSISNMLSLTTPRLPITTGFLRAQPHFTVNSSTLSASIIYSISDPRHKFSTSVLKASSLFPTMDEREQAEHIIPAHIFESGVKDHLTSNMTEKMNISTSVNPALLQQMYNDSSPRPSTAAALSSEAHISIGQLQPHQGQSAPQISQSSSDMTSGQPCSFKLSEQTAHSDALHAPVDFNEQRSVQTLMASMSPKAKNDQFPLSSTSPLLNLMPFGGDSLPDTYSLTGLTRSATEKEILRANSDAGYVNSGRGHAESLLETADETNQTEANDSLQKMATLAVKPSDAVTKHIPEKRDEKNGSPFIAQTIGMSKLHASHTDELSSFSIMQTEKLAVKNTNENNRNDMFNVDASDEANNTVKPTLESNRASRFEGYNETASKIIMFAIQTTHTIEQAINEDVVPVTNDFVIPVFDTNDHTGTTAFVKSDTVPEIAQIQANDLTNNAISDMEHHEAKTTEKQRDPSTPRGTVGVNTLPVPHFHFQSDLEDPNISTQQIMNAASDFQITTTKTNDFVSLAPTAGTDGLTVSTKAHESALTTSESVQVVFEKSSQDTHAEPTVQSLRDPPATPTTSKLPSAVKGKGTTETESAEEPGHEISVQGIEGRQHAPPGVIAVTRPIADPGPGVQTGLLNAARRTEEAHDTVATMVVEYSSFKAIKTTLPAKSAFEVRHPSYDRTPIVHTLDRANQHEKHTSSEKTSISQEILGAVADSVPPTVIPPLEIINKTSCRTVGCAKSGETAETTTGAGEIDHTAPEKMYKTQAGNMGKEHFNAAHTLDTKPANGNCSTDCPVPGKAAPQATNLDDAVLSLAGSKSDHGRATVDDTVTKSAKSVTYETLTKRWSVRVETDHLGIHEQARIAETTAQSHRETSKAQEAAATGVTLSEPEATTARSSVKTTEQTPLAENKTKPQLNRGAAKAQIFEAQNATRSAPAASKGEAALQESGRRLILSEPESESELPRLKHRRRTSPHLYLSGVTEVSDDLCGSGNYTAEMSLNLGRGVEPGDAVPAMGNLRVVINLKTNNSRINLEVTSCCLSPTIQLDLSNSTCCLFSRLAAEPAGITLLPSALPSSASFTISLFQMINYSVVYLHCDLSVCLRNRSDCERQCLQQRSSFPLEGPEAVVTNLRNRISFGPMLKEVKNSTFPEEMDPVELDLVLVIVSLVVGSSLVTVTLLLVWLAYRRRAIWLHSAPPTPACCGCLRPGGDSILP